MLPMCLAGFNSSGGGTVLGTCFTASDAPSTLLNAAYTHNGVRVNVSGYVLMGVTPVGTQGAANIATPGVVWYGWPTAASGTRSVNIVVASRTPTPTRTRTPTPFPTPLYTKTPTPMPPTDLAMSYGATASTSEPTGTPEPPTAPDMPEVMTAGALAVLANPPSGVTWRSYYYAGSQRVALRVRTTAANVVYYLHGDHLGSTSLVTCGSNMCWPVSLGGIVGKMLYTPWGESRWTSGSLPTDLRYTGQRSEEAGLGSLYDYGARFYSPYLNRFISADTIVPSPGNPQSLNRYSYVYNNALKYTDPTGHAVDDGLDGGGCAPGSNLPSCGNSSLPVPAGPPVPSSMPVSAPVSPSAQKAGDIPPWRRDAATVLSLGAVALDITSLGLSTTGVLLEVIGLAGGLAEPTPGGGELVGIAAALALYQPLNEIENRLGLYSLALNGTADWLNGSTYPRQTELFPGVGAWEMVLGQDTVASLVFTTAGFDPEPATDSIINVAVLAYDLGRLSGRIPTFFHGAVGMTQSGTFYQNVERENRP